MNVTKKTGVWDMNIAGLVPIEDFSYRYKMPKLTIKIEGSGNGIKTVLTNVTDLGQALNRDPAEITKFFGCEFGSQTSFSPDKAIVNGQHSVPPDKLQTRLSKYIENFVLCKNCRYPETHYTIKHDVIQRECSACKAEFKFSPVDMSHKLTTFILAQHKKAKEADKAAKADKKEKEKKEKKSEDAEPETSKKEKSEKSEKEKKKDKEKKEKTPEEIAEKERKKAAKKAAAEAAGEDGGDDAAVAASASSSSSSVGVGDDSDAAVIGNSILAR